MPKTDSLYELIKQKSQELGRPLKIVCDWDECLQPGKPLISWKFSPKNLTFKEYFEKFWNKSVIKYKERLSGDANDLGIDENQLWSYSYIDPEDKNEIENLKDFKKAKKRERQGLDFDKSSNPYDDKPWLSMTSELVEACKDGYVEDCILLTAFATDKHPPTGNQSKIDKCAKTFNLLPHFRLKFIPKHPGSPAPSRHSWCEQNYPDFDMFIDDNPNVIKDQNKHFPDRIYALPHYKPNSYLEAPNIYHVKTTVSDLTDEDFVKVAEEYKQKQHNLSLATSSANNLLVEKKTSIWKQPALYWGLVAGIGICLLGLGIYWLVRKKIKKV